MLRFVDDKVKAYALTSAVEAIVSVVKCESLRVCQVLRTKDCIPARSWKYTGIYRDIDYTRWLEGRNHVHI